MKKRIFMVYFALVLLFFPVSPVFAAEDAPRLVDGADLLTDSEETALRDKLDEISERQQVDLVIATTDSVEGKSPMEFADDFYDYNGYGFGDSYDGVLFLISMEERDWHISTTGFGITAITDAGREYISEKFLGDLSDGEYGAAFTAFAQLCDAFITQAREGEPYDVGNLPKEPFPLLMNLAIALIAGFLLSFIITSVMRGKLKSVHSQPMADSYIKRDSMHLTKQSDMFLYRHVNRSRKPEHDESSYSGGSVTHTSSSGRSHGGGGGKF